MQEVELSVADNNRYRLVNQQLEIEGQARDGGATAHPLMRFYTSMGYRWWSLNSNRRCVRKRQRYLMHGHSFVCVIVAIFPKLFVYNALCILSDGVNNKMGNLFAPYEFYYAWRKINGNESTEKAGHQRPVHFN